MKSKKGREREREREKMQIFQIVLCRKKAKANIEETDIKNIWEKKIKSEIRNFF